MGEVKDLISKEAVEKIKELVKQIDICLFSTKLSDIPSNTRPMSAMEVDEEGNLWFFSASNSHKNAEIYDDNRVQLYFANPKSVEFLMVYGHAVISRDVEQISRLWNPLVKAWFPGGKEDPELTMIKVTPDDSYYWDTKNNRMVSFLKIVSSAFTGAKKDDGIEGELNLR